MKKILLLIVILCLLIGQSSLNVAAQPPVTVSHELKTSYTPEFMITLLSGFFGVFSETSPLSAAELVAELDLQYSVNVYKVTYETPHPVLGTVQATGAIAVPQNLECEAPLTVYQHGTVFSTSDVPSNLYLEHYLGVALAASGYLVVMPDYLGLGDSPGMHPYVHAKTQATAAIDLMRSARELATELDYVLNQQNFIFGYSQGGHAAMALFYELETFHTDEFTVTAAAPMSGPYDMHGTQASVMWEEYSIPDYLPYVMLGYRSVYPDLLGDFNVIFKEEFDLLNNFDGDSNEFFEAIRELDIPRIPSQMILPDILAEFRDNPDHPFNVALADNNVYDWTPKAATLLMGCCDDEQVLFQNTEVAYAKFMEHGAANVEMIDFCEFYAEIDSFGHGGCIPSCMLHGKQFFDSFKEQAPCITNVEDLIEAVAVKLYPNPANKRVYIDWPAELSTNLVHTQLTDLMGKQLKNYTQSIDKQLIINLSDVPEGMYMLELSSEEIVFKSKLFVY